MIALSKLLVSLINKQQVVQWRLVDYYKMFQTLCLVWELVPMVCVWNSYLHTNRQTDRQIQTRTHKVENSNDMTVNTSLAQSTLFMHLYFLGRGAYVLGHIKG